MPDELQLHEATCDELIEAHKNCFEFWQRGRTPEEHAQNRLDNPSHQRATWYVGCLDGRVVTSFGSYPFQFQICGQVVKGMGVGSVYTVDSHRKKGYAARLMEWAERQQREKGVQISILYSDIDPNYYARMGYRLGPCFQGTCRPAEVPTERLDGGLQLDPFSASGDMQQMADLYQRDGSSQLISIVRSGETWDVRRRLHPQDLCFWFIGRDSARRGYVRLRPNHQGLRIVDAALVDRSESERGQCYAAVIGMAREKNVDRLGCWLPDTPAAHRFFEVTPRRDELTMLKPLVDTVPLNKEILDATAEFHELDHI